MNYKGGSDLRDEAKEMKKELHHTPKILDSALRNTSYFKTPALYLLITLLIFILAKIGFMLACGDGHDFSLADMGDVIWHGLSLDFSTALYFLIVPFLLSLVSIWWQGRILRTILHAYLLLTATAFSLAFVADASLYPFWGFKLDASCLQYLETPNEAAASVTGKFLLIRFLAFINFAICIYLLYKLLLIKASRTKNGESAHALGLQPKKPSSYILHPSLKNKIYTTLLYILLIPLIVIGIRGGLDESTTNIGQVYYSQNQFLNHSAVNPIFSFLSSFEKTANNIVDYDFYPQGECDRIMKGLYPTTSAGSDTLLNTQRPDIIVILMESAGEIMADVMPRLQQFKKEGIYFANCFANSWRTDRGTVCTYSGYPSFPTSSVMKMPSKTRHLPSIARTLQQEGYDTYYYYGGDINFTNMRSYLIATGFSQLVWKEDFSASDQATSKWGVCDGIMFDAVYDRVTRKHNHPLLIGFSTLSSHEPWDVPLKRLDDPVKNAFCYLDDCLGRFIDRLKATPQWENTLLVILPDHSMDYQGIDETKERRNRIPLVWTGGAVKKAKTITQLCNQTDLAATLLAQCGLPHDDFLWSRDILSQSYQYPFAIHNFNNGFSVRDSTGFMVYDLNSQQAIVNQSTDAQRQERLGKAILQATTMNLKNMK